MRVVGTAAAARRGAPTTMLATMLTLALCLAESAPADLLSRRGSLFKQERQGLHFELFLPHTWQLNAADVPVLVFLHGRGESGGWSVNNAQSLPLQLLTNRSFMQTFNFIAVVPQCPHQCAMANHWLPSTLNAITSLLREWVLQPTSAGGLGGDHSRVYLAGQSMGGHGAWTYAAQQPRLFAALVVVCGYLRGGHETRAVSQRLGHSKLPVAVYHSADDVVIPVAAADQAVAALRQTGYEDASGGRGAHDYVSSKLPIPLLYVRYEHAPGPPIEEFSHLSGHGSYELAFRDAGLYAWLLSHTCNKCLAKPNAPWSALGGDDDMELR